MTHKHDRQGRGKDQSQNHNPDGNTKPNTKRQLAIFQGLGKSILEIPKFSLGRLDSILEASLFGPGEVVEVGHEIVEFVEEGFEFLLLRGRFARVVFCLLY